MTSTGVKHAGVKCAGVWTLQKLSAFTGSFQYESFFRRFHSGSRYGLLEAGALVWGGVDAWVLTLFLPTGNFWVFFLGFVILELCNFDAYLSFGLVYPAWEVTFPKQRKTSYITWRLWAPRVKGMSDIHLGCFLCQLSQLGGGNCSSSAWIW